MEIITIFLVMVVLQKEHSGSFRKTWCPVFFPFFQEDFVQIYLFHINIRFKTSQYISGASTLILSDVCQKSIYFSMKWEALIFQLIALCHLPFCFIANKTYC